VTSHLTHQGRLGGIAMLDSTMATKRNRDVPKRNGGQKTKKNRCFVKNLSFRKKWVESSLGPCTGTIAFSISTVLQILAAWELEKGCLEWNLQDLPEGLAMAVMKINI